jgi:hypothetical protein
VRVLGAPLVAVAAVVAGEGAGLAVGDGAVLADAVRRQVVEAGALLALPVDQVLPLLALQADARWVALLTLLQQAARAHACGPPQRVLGLAAETGAVGAALAVGIGAAEAAATAEVVAGEALAAVRVALAKGAPDGRAGLAAQRLALGFEEVALEAGGAGPEVAILSVLRRAGRALGVAVAVAGEAVGAGRTGLALVVLLGVEGVAGAAGDAEVESALAGEAVGGAAGEAAAVTGVGVSVHVAVVEAGQAVALLVAGRAEVAPAALADDLRANPHQEGPLLACWQAEAIPSSCLRSSGRAGLRRRWRPGSSPACRCCSCS